MTKQPFNVADWFSLYRIFVTPFLLVLVFLDYETAFGVLVGISMLTDAIDGNLARRFKITTERGASLDSIGDVITLLVALVGLFWFHWQFILEYKFIIGFLLLLYFAQSILAYVRYGKPSSFHTYSAKASAIVLSVFFVGTFLFGVWPPIFYLAAAVALIEEIEELSLIVILPKWRANVRGLYWVLREKKSGQVDA